MLLPARRAHHSWQVYLLYMNASHTTLCASVRPMLASSSRQRTLTVASQCCCSVLLLNAAAHGHLVLIRVGPNSSYSLLDSHISWKDPSEARIDPPSQGHRARSVSPAAKCFTFQAGAMGCTSFSTSALRRSATCASRGQGRAGREAEEEEETYKSKMSVATST